MDSRAAYTDKKTCNFMDPTLCSYEAPLENLLNKDKLIFQIDCQNFIKFHHST